jgi:hypothetical protein
MGGGFSDLRSGGKENCQDAPKHLALATGGGFCFSGRRTTVEQVTGKGIRMESVQLPNEEPKPLTAAQLLERRFIIFVIAHTNSFEDAATYLNMKVGALAKRRHDYDIPTPPRGSYTGPKLTQEEMEQAFIASLATAAPVPPPAEVLEALLHEANVSFIMPGGTVKTFALSQVVSWPPNPPPRSGARMG